MRFIELFAGIGGFRYGLENIPSSKGNKSRRVIKNKDLSDNRGKQCVSTQYFTCVWANEIDKYACQIYRRNYGKEVKLVERATDTKPQSSKQKPKSRRREWKYATCEYVCSELHEGDIRKVDYRTIPDHDLLTAGFPCQSFSIAGKRGGFEDTRGTLFFEIARIVQVKRPKLLLLENVKGLLSHDQGKTFGTILATLSELGYVCEWQILNSKDFGVPQNRERVFIIGHLGRECAKTVFPIGTDDKEVANIQQETRGQQKRIQSEVSKTDRCSTSSENRGNGERRLSPTITTELAHSHGKNFTPKLIEEQKKMNMKIRRLTPTECERLQGFPDRWTEKGTTKERVRGIGKPGKGIFYKISYETDISDTQRYKALGNAVTTNVITEIGKRL